MKIKGWQKFDPQNRETWPEVGHPVSGLWNGGSGILLLFPNGEWFRFMRNDTLKPIKPPKNLLWKPFQPNYLWITEE